MILDIPPFRQSTLADPPRFVAEAQLLNMYHVYVLKSLKNNKRYTGLTQKNPLDRLKEHNNGKSSFTRKNKPFSLVYFETFNEKDKAIKRESFLKTGQGRRRLLRIIPP